jgi:hypothetical protein
MARFRVVIAYGDIMTVSARLGILIARLMLRGALHLKRKSPSWLNMPQMMRLTITTYNVLAMLGEWDVARPYDFLFLPMVDPTFGYAFIAEPTIKSCWCAHFRLIKRAGLILNALTFMTARNTRWWTTLKKLTRPIVWSFLRNSHVS